MHVYLSFVYCAWKSIKYLFKHHSTKRAIFENGIFYHSKYLERTKVHEMLLRSLGKCWKKMTKSSLVSSKSYKWNKRIKVIALHIGAKKKNLTNLYNFDSFFSDIMHLLCFLLNYLQVTNTHTISYHNYILINLTQLNNT